MNDEMSSDEGTSKKDLPAGAKSTVKKDSDKAAAATKDQPKEDNQDAKKPTQAELEKLKSINESHDDQDMMSNIVDIN